MSLAVGLIVVAATGIAVMAMLWVKRRHPTAFTSTTATAPLASSGYSQPDLPCCSGSMVFLAFSAYDAARGGCGRQRRISLAQQVETARLTPPAVSES